MCEECLFEVLYLNGEQGIDKIFFFCKQSICIGFRILTECIAVAMHSVNILFRPF